MAATDNISIDATDIERFQEALIRMGKDMSGPSLLKVGNKVGIYFSGQIRKRTMGSFDEKGTPWLGIKKRSLLRSSRSAKGKKKGLKKADEDSRIPVGSVRPLVTGGGDAARSSHVVSPDGTVTVSPAMRGKGKVATILAYHQSPEVSGHARTGSPPSPMPTRQAWGVSDADRQVTLDLYFRQVERNIQKNIDRAGL